MEHDGWEGVRFLGKKVLCYLHYEGVKKKLNFHKNHYDLRNTWMTSKSRLHCCASIGR